MRRLDEYMGRDVEEVARRAAEHAVALLAKNLLGELREIRERLDRIEAMLRDEHGRRAPRQGAARTVREYLERERYVLGSQARARLGMSPNTLLSIASGMDGVRVIEAGGDYIVFDSMGFEEFKALLASISTSDPEEASKGMGPYRDAFNALRRAGVVYFDGRGRRWRIIT